MFWSVYSKILLFFSLKELQFKGCHKRQEILQRLQEKHCFYVNEHPSSAQTQSSTWDTTMRKRRSPGNWTDVFLGAFKVPRRQRGKKNKTASCEFHFKESTRCCTSASSFKNPPLVLFLTTASRTLRFVQRWAFFSTALVIVQRRIFIP